MKTIAACFAFLVLAAPAAAQTGEAPHCTYSVPKKMRLKPALSRGIPVEVTCDGPTESNSDILTFAEAGTQKLRVNILPKRFFRRYAKTKFRVLLGVKLDPDKPWHTSVDSGKVVTVVR